MSEWQMFRTSLGNHPGVKVACWWTAMTAFAMATRNDIHDFTIAGGLTMWAIFSSFAWAPVIATAWFDRRIHSQEQTNE